MGNFDRFKDSVCAGAVFSIDISAYFMDFMDSNLLHDGFTSYNLKLLEFSSLD